MAMKRKRKNACPSPLLDESPKRTKVHAQRKFAQGSNVNSPVITPIRELESESPQSAILPEPVELLPIKRPNTEDFLTFLCFRGTPILPPSLNFFNTASIVDTNGQVHEIKSEASSKNGPIDIAKCGSSSEKPFVAFGVRKRADPIVISRQMDRKRRHALALQALRRKYQEQKMAKIRALTISKLSEKVTNKTLVRTNTVSKTETITKKTNTNTLHKTKVVATKHIKVTTRTLKTTMRPKMKMKQNMCLRSFRGRFIQQELPFRKRVIPNKCMRSSPEKKGQHKTKMEDYGATNEPSTSNQYKSATRKIVNSPSKIGLRCTRSSDVNKKSEIRRKQIKRILIPNSHTIIKPKPRSLRLTTMKKSVLSRRQNRSLKIKSKLRHVSQSASIENSKRKETRIEQKKYLTNAKGEVQKLETRHFKETINKTVESKESNRSKEISRDYKKITDLKEVTKTLDRNKRHLTRSLENERNVNISTDSKKTPKLAVSTKKSKVSKVVHKKINDSKNVEKKNSEEIIKRSTRQTSNEDTKIGVNRKAPEYGHKKTKAKSMEKEDAKDKSNIRKSRPKFVKNEEEQDNSSETDVTLKRTEKSISTRNSKKAKQVIEEKSSNKSFKEKTSKISNKTVHNSSGNEEENSLDTDTKKDCIKKLKSSIETIKEDNELNKDKSTIEKGKSISSSRKNNFAKKLDHVSKEENLNRETKKNSNEEEENNGTTENNFIERDTTEDPKRTEEVKVKDENIKFLEDSTVKSDRNREGDLTSKAVAKSEPTEENIKHITGEDEDNCTEKQNQFDKNNSQEHADTVDKTKKRRESVESSDPEEIKSETPIRKSKRENRINPYEKEDNNGPRSQRPSRKTKEAAAIYMELLSQKLVNDGRGDDDNVSIDSFPELPNVKRTQQRENELKAKAKTPKDDKETDDNEDDSIPTIKRAKTEGNFNPNAIDDRIENTEINDNDESTKLVNKRKNGNLEETDEITVKPKLRKSSESKIDKIKPKRLIRHASQPKLSDYDDDSDESFYIDVKVSRRKKSTRSRVSRVTKGTKILNTSSSDSDRSTTSDVNPAPVTSKAKNKKFSKTKTMKKAENDLSDSEDEPLLKRASKNTENGQKSSKGEKSKESVSKETRKCLAKAKSTPKSPEPESIRIEPKPKRECTKLPQNYLPMFSSSDEDEIFHGFDEKVETKSKNFEVPYSHAPPLLNLLNKDLSRRFGKEKVNMSNEQIEKWLKDSALAGSSIKKENDEMLKFGERIPTETSLEMTDTIDTEKLKQSLLGEPKKENKDEKTEPGNVPPAKTEDISKPGDPSKPQIDRKLIFRKSKTETIPTPNINAFSPENESSVYAFGEENDEIVSTPFRRPSRRPSSTATSKSEDESSKHDELSRAGQFRKPTTKQEIPKGIPKDEPETTLSAGMEESKQFYIPQNPTKCTVLKVQNKSLFKSKSSERLLDNDEFKYKIPSSPSASSSSSAKLYKRQTLKQKTRPLEFMTPTYASNFPKNNEPAKLVEAPVFHPTEQEFQDPLEYIERIRHKAERFGICKIVPPNSFKPECKVTDDMRFTAYNQYVNKMLYRWGPNFKEFMAIKKYLETQSISLSHPPWIGGMEIDLPRLYQTVQSLGGLKEVIEKKKWSKVSELMKIPKSAQDRVTKLDDIYCKYLLPYDTLSPVEREKLFDEVETEWAKKESRNLVKNQENKCDVSVGTETEADIDDDSEECITKGRNMALNAFYRIARNTMSMYFRTSEPLPQEVEQEYWKYVVMRENHLCVHSGSIDCGNWGYGFAVTKNSPFAKHPWNLKMLTNNVGSVLRSLGPLMGVTVPTLHVGMVFSACSWYRDPHGLPWIEYLHTGGTKIWYGIPNSMGDQFRASLKHLVPSYCKNKELWLPSDTIMVPPNLLVENNVSLCHAVQEPGQFIVVFPKAFTSCISTGYVVSESVFFAPIYWLKTARALFNSLKQSNEPSMFSLDRLLISVVNDGKCNIEIVRQTLPLIQELCSEELAGREKLANLGDVTKEKFPIPEVAKGKKKKYQQGEDGDYECEICRSSLFLSMIFDTVEGVTYCLDHALEMAEKKELLLDNCKFMFTYDDEELKLLPEKVKASIESRLQKKVPNKFAGMPTLLGK